jgi:hypothetical protein
MSKTKFAAMRLWLMEFIRPIGAWWGIMSGAVSIPFMFLALFNVFSARFLFAALACVSLWVLVIAQYRRLSALTQFKLTVLPGYHVIGSDDSNSVIVELSLWNNSEPPAELHNIFAEFWTNESFISRALMRPTRRIPTKPGPVFVYYNFSDSMLHKRTSIQIAQWSFRAPSEGEFIPIGIRVVSSETDWQTETWQVVRDGERVRITPSGQQRPT